jgi:hypothetical protein
MKARIQVLDRLQLRSPPLPLPLLVVWPRRRDAYAKRVAEKNKERTGKVFLDRINGVLKDLGKFYDGPTPYNKNDPMAGREKAFERFVVSLGEWTPKAVTSVTL